MWLLFYFGIRPYRLDHVRFQLFTLRNELFLLAANGRVKFDDPAYLLLRNRINALIRFAHIITAGRIMFIGICERSMVDQMAKQTQQRWEAALGNLRGNERKAIEGLNSRIHLLIAKHVITGNIPLMICYAVAVLLSRTTDRAREEKVRFARKIHVEILEEQASIAQRQESELADLQPA
jgi:hypothetical protein